MYIISFIITLLAPVAIFVVGIAWKVSPPPFDRDSGLAYRTALSSSSQEAWAFAHKHCAKLWIRIGLILCVITVVLMAAFRESYRSFFLWLIGGQMLFFCCSAFLVDILLKSNFDEQGKPLK